MYKDSSSFSLVNSQTEFCNILVVCKNVFNEYLEDCVNKTVLVEIAVNVLIKYFNFGIELKMRRIFWFILDQGRSGAEIRILEVCIGK